MKDGLVVSVGGYSGAGAKKDNQDAFAASQPSATQVRYKGIALCVADGVSCSERAQQASQISVTHFVQDYYSTPDSWDVKTAAGRVLSSLNSWLYHQGRQATARHNGLVTTFSAVVFKSTTAHIVHVGDSRIFRLRNQQLELLTRDHTHRQGGSAYLSRALGMDTHLEVDYQQRTLEVGDIYVLCTDGLHGYLEEEWLREELSALSVARQRELTQAGLEAQCRRFYDQALARGSDDNATCLILRVEALPEPDIDEAQRELTQRIIPPVMAVGDKIDGFQVTQVLYAGTRSHLYRVRQLDGRREFVLKAPSLNFQEDLVYLEGFMREQWVGSRIDHPNIMKIYPLPDASRFLYHLCECIDGESLRQWMYDRPTPPLADVRHIAEQLIRALRAFQRAGMVHRDLKPENVMITRDGQVKLIDFGTVLVRGLSEIAAAVEEDCPVGSVNYIAPEYVLNNVATSQSDLFSLGVVLYEMLTGEQPFAMDRVHRRGAKSVSQWQYRSLRRLRPDLPPWLDLTLEKACAPALRKRYAAFSELWTDLLQPNPALQSNNRDKPLLERNPLRVWQVISGLLLVIVLLQAYFLSR